VAIQIVDGIRRRDRPRWWIGLLLGLLELVAGVLALIWPGISAVALAAVVGAWALVTGFIEILSAVRQRRGRAGDHGTLPGPGLPLTGSGSTEHLTVKYVIDERDTWATLRFRCRRTRPVDRTGIAVTGRECRWRCRPAASNRTTTTSRDGR
jgi:hypothetical protein